MAVCWIVTSVYDAVTMGEVGLAQWTGLRVSIFR